MINFLNKYNMLQCEDLSTHCTMRVGGKAKYYIEPLTASQLVEIVKQCNKLKIKYFILGNGSNVIFKDKGFDGVVICTKNIMDMREKHMGYRETARNYGLVKSSMGGAISTLHRWERIYLTEGAAGFMEERRG